MTAKSAANKGVSAQKGRRRVGVGPRLEPDTLAGLLDDLDRLRRAHSAASWTVGMHPPRLSGSDLATAALGDALVQPADWLSLAGLDGRLVWRSTADRREQLGLTLPAALVDRAGRLALRTRATSSAVLVAGIQAGLSPRLSQLPPAGRPVPDGLAVWLDSAAAAGRADRSLARAERAGG